MSVKIVLISDLRFGHPERPALGVELAAKVAESIGAANGDTVVGVLLGSLTDSASDAEFAAVANFLRQVREELGGVTVRFAAVPGDRDCDWLAHDVLRKMVVEGVELGDLPSNVVDVCLGVQHRFDYFLREAGDLFCHSGLRLWDTVDLPEVGVVLHLANTCWANEPATSQGTVDFPPSVLGTGADGINVLVSHHSPSWFARSTRVALHDWVEQSCDIWACGKAGPVGDDAFLSEVVPGEPIGGFSFQQEYLAFSVLSLGHAGYSHRAVRVSLDGEITEVRGEEEVTYWRRISLAPQGLPFSDEFEELLSDLGTRFLHPHRSNISLDDLFVPPNLQTLAAPGKAAGLERESFRSKVAEVPRLLIVGPSKSGKTTCAKQAVRTLRRVGITPLFMECERPGRHWTLEGALGAASRRCYNLDFQGFVGGGGQRLGLVVDDYHLLGRTSAERHAALEQLGRTFDSIVLFSDEHSQMEELLDEGIAHHILEYEHCQILPMGHALRAELIRRWLALDGGDDATQCAAVKTERFVTECVGRGLVDPWPVFVLFVVQQVESQQRGVSDAGSVGYVYEALITDSLRAELAHGRVDASLDTLYAYLASFAARLYQAKQRSADEATMDEWHSEYEQTVRIRLVRDPLIRLLVDAEILVRRRGELSFRYRYIYYYFVARYLRDGLDRTEVRDEINDMATTLFHEESANILMFLTYLSRSGFVLQTVLDAAGVIFEDEKAQDLFAVKSLPSPEVRRLELPSTTPAENRAVSRGVKDDIDYPEAEAGGTDAEMECPELDPVVSEFTAALRTVRILGQILRNYIGSLDGEKKEEIVRSALAVQRRALSKIVGVVEDNHQELVIEVAEWLRDDDSRSQPEVLSTMEVEVARKLVRSYLEVFGLGSVIHFAVSVGHEKLSPTLKAMESKFDDTDRLFDLAVRLEHLTGFPMSRLRELEKRAKKAPFARRLMQNLVWRHFYLFESDRQTRQKACELMDIKLSKAVEFDDKRKIR